MSDILSESQPLELFMEGVLCVHLRNARIVTDGEVMYLSSFYVLLSLDKQQQKSASNGLEKTIVDSIVVWDQSFFFDVKRDNDMFEVRLWSSVQYGESEMLGLVRIELDDVKSSRSLIDDYYALEDENGVPTGIEIELGLSYSNNMNRRKVVFTDFELLKILGKGTFGRVYQVRKLDTDNIYAMKVMRKDDVIKTNAVKYTMMENEILKNINHPFILGLKYSFQTHKHLFLVTDYFGGGELFYHLNEEDFFAEERVKLYAAQIILALSYLHQNGIIYRDLKPENLLLDIQGNICLIDFGLSKTEMEDSDTTSSFCGSKEYVSPEMLQNKPYGKEIDWWALGIVIYELIDGNPPFWDENEHTMFKSILTQMDIDFPEYFSDDCVDFILGLLMRNPKKRLGYGKDGLKTIKNHGWFSDLDWIKVYKKEYTPIFRPHISDHTDASNFDSHFTEQNPMLSYEEKSEFSYNEDIFQGFSYDGPGAEILKLKIEEKNERRRTKVTRRSSLGMGENPNNFDDTLFDLDF